MGVVGVGRHVEDVLVLRGDVPVADERDVVAAPGVGGRPELGQPVELVVVVRVVDLAAVGHVQRPDPYAATGRAEGPRLHAGRLAPRRLAGEADLDVLQADAAEHGDAVPLVQARDGGVVPQCLQAHQWQLVLAGLGLLQREHVDLVPLQQRLDPVDPRAQRVDVPGGDPHDRHPTTGNPVAPTGVDPAP